MGNVRFVVEQLLQRYKQEAVEQGRSFRVAGGDVVTKERVCERIDRAIAETMSPADEPTVEGVRRIAAEVKETFALLDDEALYMLVCNRLHRAR